MMDPFSATPMMILVCNIVEPGDGSLYGRDPRSTAVRAEAYLKSTGIGDTVYVGPEPEFFMFDDVQFEDGYDRSAVSGLTISSCQPIAAAIMMSAIWGTAPAPRVVISR